MTVTSQPILSFENEISLDANKELSFKVLLTLSDDQGIFLQLSNHAKTFQCSVKSYYDMLELGSPVNLEGKKNLKVFFNATKQLLSKKSTDQQQLGYFFFEPNSSDFQLTSRVDKGLKSKGSIKSHYNQLGKPLLYLRFTIYDSINEEEFVYYLVLSDVGSVSPGSGETHGNLSMVELRLQKIVDSLSSKMNALIEDNEYWRRLAVQAGGTQVSTVKPKQLLSPLQNVVLSPKSFPFVFGVLSRCEDSNSDSAALSSELGQWYNSGAEHMASVLFGVHGYGNQYILFNRPPSVNFLQGSTGTFLYKEQHVVYSNTNAQSYPRAMLGAFFIKNPTNNQIRFTLSHGGTSYWNSGYEGASVFLGTPNQTIANRNSISSITWTNVYSLPQSNENIDANTAIDIPAQRTVCLLIYTSARYYTANNNHMTYTSGWKVFNLRTALVNAGLELDHELTLKAVQCEGISNLHQLWHQ